MVKVGENFSIPAERLNAFAEATKTNVIEVAGGLAVVRTIAARDGLADFPWLIGMSAHRDSSSTYSFHRLVPSACKDSVWCMGTLSSPDGVVVQTLNVPDPLNAAERYNMLIELAGEGDDPFLAKNTAALDLVRQFHAQGHTFDPTAQPVLHAALQQLVQ